jgi:thiol-disulfide isomerase/thioredoxin/mono/diheme cytochrome c family protein
MSKRIAVMIGTAIAFGVVIGAALLYSRADAQEKTVPATPVARSAPPAPLGSRVSNWSLPRSSDGKSWSMGEDARDAKVVVVLFLGTQCPINNLYAPIFANMASELKSKGVEFVGINSNDQDDRDAILEHSKRFDLPFPVLRDEGAKVADRFAAERTPEAFVLDGERIVRYRGRIDDRYAKGVHRAEANRRDLAEAIDEVLAGRAVSQPAIAAAGCPISRPDRPALAKDAAPATYTKHVSRILQKHCQECHRPGEGGPFSLMTYKEARSWSGAIREEVESGRMPPWHADPKHGKFKNERRLTDAERSALLNWIDQGCTEGDAADLPMPRVFTKGWQIGQPDIVFTMPYAVPIPAVSPRGGVPYKFEIVSEPFEKETWIQAVECRPSEPGVVHHITAFLVAPGTDVKRWKNQSDVEQLVTSYSDEYFLGGYGLGEDPLVLPPGKARRIPKGARIAFEIHYTPNGIACADRSYVGMIYAPKAPEHQVLTGSAMNLLFFLPPGRASFKSMAIKRFDKAATILSLTPHMHLRGRSGEFVLVRPDDSRELLLSVPNYNFFWQTNYELATPLSIPAGSKIEYTAIYDNSKSNLLNPDPRAWVRWGEQSWDEMMIGFFDYYWTDPK